MNETITINLTIPEKKFLLYIADNHNEIYLNHNNLPAHVVKYLNVLEMKGAISKAQSLTQHGVYRYKLTSIGSNLVDLIR